MKALLLLASILLLPDAARAQPAGGALGSVVRSKEWIVRRGKAREEEFVGAVRYDAAGTSLASDWALFRQETKDWQARGAIVARKELSNGDVVETKGEKARYSELTLAGALEPARGGRVPLLLTPRSGEPEHAEADRLDWVGQSVGVLTGRARGWGPHGEFWADAARYERVPGQSLTLSGKRPVAHDYHSGLDAALKADLIVSFDAPRRGTATGRAVGWILTQSTTTSASRGPARCGPEGPGPDARITALLSPGDDSPSADDELRFWKAEEAALTARACPWGPRLEFWADEAHFTEADDRGLTLDGGRPVLRKIDEDGESAALKADIISAFGSPRRVVAVGKVKGWMTFKDDKKSPRKKK